MEKFQVPPEYKTLIFDMDGVILHTDKLHARAWEEMLNFFIQEYNKINNTHIPSFSISNDYYKLINGVPRITGIKNFLEHRGITLPENEEPGQKFSIQALAKSKNEIFNSLLETEGIEKDNFALSFLKMKKGNGKKTALITSSKNGRKILKAARITQLFDVIIDGNDAEEKGIAGKPAPDIFVAACNALETPPSESVVFEDAVEGIKAAHEGGFGFLVAVDRQNQFPAFQQAGANIIITSFQQLL